MSELSDTMIRMNLQPWFAESKLIFYSNLMSTEFRRYNFGDVIQIYKEHFEICKIDMNMKKNLSHIFSSMELQFHEALLRQGKGSVDTFISLSKLRITHGRKVNDTLELDMLRSANFLRTAKHFDAAIVLGKQLEKLTGDRLSLATTYLEQYIVGDKSLPEDFVIKGGPNIGEA
jgi:hypothetical protein